MGGLGTLYSFGTLLLQSNATSKNRVLLVRALLVIHGVVVETLTSAKPSLHSFNDKISLLSGPCLQRISVVATQVTTIYEQVAIRSH